MKGIKRAIAVFLAACVFCSVGFLGLQGAALAGQYFVPSGWAEAEFSAAQAYGLIPDSVFINVYQLPITRGDFCELMMQTYHKILPDEVVPIVDSPFIDTNNTAVTEAYSLGIISGVSATEFVPYRLISRQEIAKILSNLLDLLGDDRLTTGTALLDALADRAEVSAWAEPFVAKMLNSGYMKGTSAVTFAPKTDLSMESAVLLAVRIFENHKPENAVRNEISLLGVPAESFFPIGTLPFTWASAEAFSNAEVRLYYVEYASARHAYSAPLSSFSGSLPIDSRLDGLDGYLFITADGVNSKPIHIYFGEKGLRIRDSSFVFEPLNNRVSFAWTGVPEASSYEVDIVEARLNGAAAGIGPRPVQTIKNGSNTFLTHTINQPRQYELTVWAVDANGGRLPFYDTFSFMTEWYQYNDFYEFFGGDPILSKEDADRQMTTITVPVWKIDKNWNKLSSTMNIVVNYRLADKFTAVFTDIYNGAEQFPLKNAGGYSWRTPGASGNMSEHNYGTAVDLNSDENYCVYANGTIVGKYWKPYEDIYSILPYGDVVTAFERHGFTWGGDAWSSTRDYMHFSYLGT